MQCTPYLPSQVQPSTVGHSPGCSPQGSAAGPLTPHGVCCSARSSGAQQTNAQNRKLNFVARCAAGTKVGVVGLGGLGHLALQFAAKLGAEVSLMSWPGITQGCTLWAVEQSLSCHDRPSLCSCLQSCLDIIPAC